MPVSKKRKPHTKPRKESSVGRLQKGMAVATGISFELDALEGSAQSPGILGRKLALVEKERRAFVLDNSGILPAEGWGVLSHIPVADAALSSCAAPWPKHSGIPGDLNWGSHLRWGLDQCVEIMRLIRAGHTYGALMATRTFLERWTLNTASSHSVVRDEGEEDSAYITRVWAVYAEHPYFVRDLGADWRWLSECIHGRGEMPEVLLAFPSNITASRHISATVALNRRMVAIADHVLMQVRGGIATFAAEKEQLDLVPLLQGMVSTAPTSLEDPAQISDILTPLDPLVVFSRGSVTIQHIGVRYQSLVSLPKVRQSLARGVLKSVQVHDAFVERRARAITLAAEGFINEAEIYPPEKHHPYLLTLLYRFIAIAEASALLASKSTGHEAAALRTAASALQSAWPLWLNDNDLALACVRGLVEQTARARTHRLKPDKAQRMEERMSSPNRWIEAAGLKRLKAFGRALGEFSHIALSSRRDGARAVLIDLQPSDAPFPNQTARIHALENATYFLANELLSRFEDGYPKLANAFREAVTLLDQEEHERLQDEWLNRSHAQKEADWGELDFAF